MYKLPSILSKFADSLAKKEDSNIGKIFKIFSEQLGDLKFTNQRIKEWRLIDNAEGIALDLIGENVLQPRGVATDEVYRVLLKSKIARNLSTGDINTIIRVLSLALDSEPSDVSIQETWADDVNPQPAGISVIQVPLRRLNEVGLPADQFARIIQRTVSAGVKVNSIELSGTFEFGSPDLQVDAEAGFSSVNAPDSGGYLGSAFVPASNEDLPI